MLKQAKELYIEILSVEDYIELFGKPNDTFGEQDQELLYRLIKQATTQFDSLVSPSGNVGYLYRWWNELKDNEEDNSKGFRLQKAIGSWVETMVQNGKFWIEGVPNMSSNIDYDIKSSSKNSNVELKRKDIIQDLVACGLTITSNLGGYDNNVSSGEVEDYLIYSKNYLNENYVSLNSLGENQQFRSGVNLCENPITNCGDIWNTNNNKRTINNFRLKNCIIDGNNDNNQIIGVQNAQTSDKILDPKDMTYKLINQFDISYWNGLTKEQIYSAIQSGGVLWNESNNYHKDYVVMYKLENPKRNKNGEFYGFALSLVDNNMGNNPNTSPNEWKILPSQPTDINSIIQYIKEYVDNDIVPKLTTTTIPQEINKQLNELPTIDYVSEGKGELINFDNDGDFLEYKKNMGVDDSYFEDINNDSFFIGKNNFMASYFKNGNDFGNWNFSYENKNTFALKLTTHSLDEIIGNNDFSLKIPLNYNISNQETFTGNYFFGRRIYVFDSGFNEWTYTEAKDYWNANIQPNINEIVSIETNMTNNSNELEFFNGTSFYKNENHKARIDLDKRYNMIDINGAFITKINRFRVYYTKRGE